MKSLPRLRAHARDPSPLSAGGRGTTAGNSGPPDPAQRFRPPYPRREEPDASRHGRGRSPSPFPRQQTKTGRSRAIAGRLLCCICFTGSGGSAAFLGKNESAGTAVARADANRLGRAVVRGQVQGAQLIQLTSMSEDEASLFDLEPPPPPVPPAVAPIRADQVQDIRQAFESAGLMEQDQRKSFVESVVVREVASLRDLNALEAHRLLKRVRAKQSQAGPAAKGSAWDNRDHDTWIDKL